jgi:single-strand DNA-binding protein
MSSNNIVIWAGVVTQDVQLKYGQSGKACLSLNVGTTKRWKDRDGNKQEKRCYHEIKLFGKDAEEAAAKAGKLCIVFCRGSLEMETWESQGQKRSKHVVSVDFPSWENLQIFPPKEWEERGEPRDDGYRKESQRSDGGRGNRQANTDFDPSGFEDDEIRF